jgi:hypothetical protein
MHDANRYVVAMRRNAIKKLEMKGFWVIMIFVVVMIKFELQAFCGPKCVKQIFRSFAASTLVQHEPMSPPSPAPSVSLSNKKAFFCYFLQARNLTYNGYTNDVKRRIRQHNREISGGARSTHRGRGMWEYLAILHSPTWSKIRSMQVEWLCRYPTRCKPRPRRFSRPFGRVTSLAMICSQLPSSEPTYLYVDRRYLVHVFGLGLPGHVQVGPLESLLLPQRSPVV